MLANTGQTITMGNVVGGSAGNLTASTIGSDVCLYAENTSASAAWYTWTAQGSWALT